MTAIDAVKASGVTAKDAARAFGLVIERNGRGKCPWHGGGNEKHGALAFRNGNCHCFACGNGGDAIALAGQMLHLEAKEAAEALCGALGIAFDGKADGQWKQKKREIERERAKADAEKRKRIEEHTRLCRTVLEIGKKLEGWTPEMMEQKPDVFWEMVGKKAMVEERIEVLEAEMRST